MFFDHRKDEITTELRSDLLFFAAPIQYFANIPAALSSWGKSSVRTRDDLIAENERLKDQVLLLQRRVQKMIALSAENVRLRELLNSSARVDDSVLVAEIIGVDPDPFRHEIIINKGFRSGVKVGQPVLDSTGLMGQVIEAGPFTSRALLISDASHATPVEVNRNGIRAIVVGSGQLDKLHVIHLPDTADVAIGDILVSSGLGGRFPYGYPVAEISRIEHDPGEPFAIVEAVPLSKLDRARHILVVLNQSTELKFDSVKESPTTAPQSDEAETEAVATEADDIDAENVNGHD